MSFAFIINPNSAKGDSHIFLEKLKKKIENPHYIISQSMEDSDRFITENWDNVSTFVAVGGDGTISSVAKKLINTDKILAIFPAGSGNGFANETNFNKDIDLLIKKLNTQNYREIDSFLVNEHLSINVSGTGFDSEVAKEFEKTNRGFFNYIKSSFKTFIKFKSINIIFQQDLQQYNGKYLMVNIANTRQFGNNAYIAPHAQISDGLLDVVLVKRFPFTYAIIFAYKMFKKKLKENNYIKYLSVPEIEFSTNSNNWHIDGDAIQISSPIKIKILPKSLKILI